VSAVAQKLGHPQISTSTRTISTLYFTVKDHTELAFAVVKRDKQIHRAAVEFRRKNFVDQVVRMPRPMVNYCPPSRLRSKYRILQKFLLKDHFNFADGTSLKL
jgi:hypothetical protein